MFFNSSSAKKDGKQSNEQAVQYSLTEAAWETVVSDNPTRSASTNWVNHFGKTRWNGKWFKRTQLYHISIPFTCRHEQLSCFPFFSVFNQNLILSSGRKKHSVSTNQTFLCLPTLKTSEKNPEPIHSQVKSSRRVRQEKALIRAL